MKIESAKVQLVHKNINRTVTIRPKNVPKDILDITSIVEVSINFEGIIIVLKLFEIWLIIWLISVSLFVSEGLNLLITVLNVLSSWPIPLVSYQEPDDNLIETFNVLFETDTETIVIFDLSLI